MIITNPPLETIVSMSFPPGIYVSVYDSMSSTAYILNLDEAADKRIADKLSEEDRISVKKWPIATGISESEIDTADTAKLLDQWFASYDPKKNIPGMTNARRNYYVRLNNALKGLLSAEPATVMQANPQTNELAQIDIIQQTDYVNVGEVANVRVLPLGTDNFGRDVLTELISATCVSLQIGFVAGLIATLIGLTLGLLAGYIGGFVDHIIMFITNLFIVIPPFVLLILISFSIGQEQRGAFTIAVVIGLTSWVWTARAVRSQVISLRNRDHVNL